MDTDKALEMAQCAKINMENAYRICPSLRQNHMLVLVEVQIDECIKALGEEP